MSTAPGLMREHVRRLWLAGSDPDSIARACGTHRAAIATHLIALSDVELLAGLRSHFEFLIAARADSKPGKRPSGGRSA